LTGWGNSTRTNDAPVKNDDEADSWGTAAVGTTAVVASKTLMMDGGGEVDGDDAKGNAPQGKGMLDERRSGRAVLITRVTPLKERACSTTGCQRVLV